MMLQCPSARDFRERLADSDSLADKGRISKVVLCFVQKMGTRLKGRSKKEQEHTIYFYIKVLYWKSLT